MKLPSLVFVNIVAPLDLDILGTNCAVLGVFKCEKMRPMR